jgi:hypothetical protein
MERERLKEERERERAAQIAAQNIRKAIQNAPPTKRKAPRAPLSNPKLKRPKGAAAAVPASLEAAPAALPKVNSRGRNILVPAKYR